jgi:beta-N-acetylhexosaminidase
MPNIFIVDLQGTEILEEEIAILEQPNVGALLLFTRNFTSPQQLKNLLDSVHSIRPDIFIAIDQEGGIVQRLQRHGFRSLPAARVYGEVYDLNAETGIKLARQFGEIMASDLLAYGIDLSFAPVLDIHGASDVIGKLDRAFHHDPEVVIELARAFIHGMNNAGMPAVGKHFPGHGSVSADSHIAMPVSDDSKERLWHVDLWPFIKLVGENLLGAVMPAHVTYPSIDPNKPAGFSKIWLQTVLRGELNFQGLIISDCLGMVGADIGNMDMRANQALTAGCDMLIVCNQDRTVLSSLLQTLTFQQTKESLHRIEAFKSCMLGFSPDKIAKILPPVAAGLEPKDILSLSENQALNNTTAI